MTNIYGFGHGGGQGFGPRLAIIDIQPFVAALVYSLVGVVLFALAFYVIVRVAPFSVRKEIEEDQNVALGIIIASVFIGIALIISAAMHG